MSARPGFFTDVLLGFFLTVLAASAHAQPSEPTVISSVTLAVQHRQTRLFIRSDRLLAYTAATPSGADEELVLFFPDTTIAATLPSVDESHPHLRSLAANTEGEKPVITRFRIGMKQGVHHEVYRKDDGILVVFDSESGKPGAATGSNPPEKTARPEITLKSVDVVSGEHGVEILVNAGAPMSSYESFIIRNPPRIVVDISGIAVESEKETIVPVRSSRIQAIRHFPTHEGLRVVIEVENGRLPDFSAQPTPLGLRIETRRTEAVLRQKGPARIRRIGFTATDSGSVACAVEANRPLEYTVQRTGPGRLSLTLINASLPESLHQVDFSTATVSMAAPEIQQDKGTIVISARCPEASAFMVEQHDATLVWRIEGASDDTGEMGNGAPPPLAAAEIPFEDDIRQEISAFIERWKAAWEATAGKTGNMDAYMAHYSESFFSGDLNKAGWRSDKQRKNSGRSWILGRVMDLSIIGAPQPGQWKIRFLLDYQAENYSEILEKTMTIAKEPAGLAIVGETSRLATRDNKNQ